MMFTKLNTLKNTIQVILNGCGDVCAYKLWKEADLNFSHNEDPNAK